MSELVKYTETVALSDGRELTFADIRKQMAPANATDKEVLFFMGICNSYKLDPFKREIYLVKYGNAAANHIIGYEVFLKRAEATGMLDGWNVEIKDYNTADERAVITIYRKDRKYPVIHEAYREEWDAGQALWKTKRRFMLKKVAIGQGFRLAFPEQLGGMPYLKEEIPDGGFGGHGEQKAIPETGFREVTYEEVNCETVGQSNVGKGQDSTVENDMQLYLQAHFGAARRDELKQFLIDIFGTCKWTEITAMDYDEKVAGFSKIKDVLDGVSEDDSLPEVKKDDKVMPGGEMPLDNNIDGTLAVMKQLASGKVTAKELNEIDKLSGLPEEITRSEKMSEYLAEGGFKKAAGHLIREYVKAKEA